jgi:HEPN domain-containing protein
MTTHEHIKELTTQAEIDYGAAEALYKAGFYAHALFWAHLVLEKLCKALWISVKQNVHYPYIHNLLRLLKEADATLSEEQTKFYATMNQFQAAGRYNDDVKKLEQTVSKNTCKTYLEKTKIQMQWLLQLMQKP